MQVCDVYLLRKLTASVASDDWTDQQCFCQGELHAQLRYRFANGERMEPAHRTLSWSWWRLKSQRRIVCQDELRIPVTLTLFDNRVI